MARDFDGVDDQLQIDQAVVTGTPLTMACWFNSRTLTDLQILMMVVDKDVTNHYLAIGADGNEAGDPVQIFTNDGGTADFAATTSGYSADTWHHACAVFAADDDRRVYLDGGSKGTSSASRSPANLDRTTLGIAGNGLGFPMDGLIAEAAIWDVALTDDEVAVLAAGFSPPQIRPADVVSYWPLVGNDSPEPDRWSGGNHLTVTGATKADHYPGMRYRAGML